LNYKIFADLKVKKQQQQIIMTVSISTFFL